MKERSHDWRILLHKKTAIANRMPDKRAATALNEASEIESVVTATAEDVTGAVVDAQLSTPAGTEKGQN